MVKHFIAQFLKNYGLKALSSVFRAHKEVNANRPAGEQQEKPKEEAKTGFKFQNLIITPMTRTEALQILNLHEAEKIEAAQIISQFEKFVEANEPSKGGSFYIQNKVYYAKEFLIKDFPPSENVSRFNPKSKE